MTEDKMVGWHHQLNGHEFEQALGNSGEGSGCDQAPQEVLQTQAQQGCSWEGEGQQGPGPRLLPPVAHPSPLRTVPGTGLALGLFS